MNRTGKKIMMAAAVFMLAFNTFSNPKKVKNMKVKANQMAPEIQAKDVNGKEVNLADLKGKKILLTFFRNVGCPVCNFRVHELMQQYDSLKAKGLVFIAIYESSRQQMLQYIENENIPFTMIPDPEHKLYNLYNVERSTGKMLGSFFKGEVIKKVMKGQKQFNKKLKQDGHKNQMEADFLINEKGEVVVAHYGTFIGDHIPLEKIKEFAKGEPVLSEQLK